MPYLVAMSTMLHDYAVPLPLRDDVVVWIEMTDGTRIESAPMPGVVADSQRHAILMHRDKELNYERCDLPDWLPSGFDLSTVRAAGAVYRGA
jgi:hypothetical protein